MSETEFPKSRKLIFTIMPFTESPTRNTTELQEYFEHEIKRSIETNGSFVHSYEVRRSGVDLDITGQIIRDLYDADIVICDLSGKLANPNVTFELGVRLTCSGKPVILIREESPDNKPIFDLQSLHTYLYNPKAYSGLRLHLEDKIKRFESGQETYQSPVLAVLADEAKAHRIGRVRAANLVAMLQVGLASHLGVFLRLLNSYLLDKGTFQFEDNIYFLSRQIEDNYALLQTVDWSDIRLAIGPHPALSYYLSTRYLDGVIEESLEKDFSVRILRFFESHFINMMGLIDFDLLRVRAFAEEASLLCVGCSLMREILNAEEESPKYLESTQKLRNLLTR